MTTPPIYVINLARRTDRMAAMARNLAEAGLTYTRVEAIDAQAVTADWLDTQFAPPGRFGPLSPPEQACGLSHFRALEHFVTAAHAGARHAVIFEDDIQLSAEAGDMLASLDWLPASTRLLKIERERDRVLLGRPRPVEAPHPACVAPLHCDHTGTAGYIVSREAAQALLSIRPKPTLPYDFLLFNPSVSPLFRRLKPQQLMPPLVEQMAQQLMDSDIEPSRTDLNWARNHPRGVAKIRREVLRVYRQGARFAATALGGARWTTIEPLSPARPPLPP